MPSTGSGSSGSSTTRRSRAPGSSPGTAQSRVASTRCDASSGSRAWTRRSWTPSSGTGGTTRSWRPRRSTRCPRAPTTRPRSGCCAASSHRSSARRIRARRVQRAYALLARNGFGPDVCSTVSRRVARGGRSEAADIVDVRGLRASSSAGTGRCLAARNRPTSRAPTASCGRSDDHDAVRPEGEGRSVRPRPAPVMPARHRGDLPRRRRARALGPRPTRGSVVRSPDNRMRTAEAASGRAAAPAESGQSYPSLPVPEPKRTPGAASPDTDFANASGASTPPEGRKLKMEPIVVRRGLVAAVVGVAVGFVARGILASQTIKAAQDKAARIVAEARTQQKDMILEAKDEKLRLQREAEDEARAKRDRARRTWSAASSRATSSSTSARTCSRSESRKILDRERDLEHAARGARPSSTRSASPPSSGSSGMSAEDAKGVLLEADPRGGRARRRQARPRPSSGGPARRPRRRPATSSSPRCSASPRTTRPSTPSRSSTCRATR